MDPGSGACTEIAHVINPSLIPADTGLKGTDPLQGLVADDILDPFRAFAPVGNADSVYDEAFALGCWVQDRIGKNKVPGKIRGLGDSIGLRYEFHFGTDVSNNFDNNFPRIYGTYYALKDFYTSGGKRNADYYALVCEDNELLGYGDPEDIKKMYADLRDFVTACNNFVRAL
jgi:hypothetical protein